MYQEICKQVAEKLNIKIVENNMLPHYVAISLSTEGVDPIKFRKDLGPNDKESMELVYKDLIEGNFFTTVTTAENQKEMILSLRTQCKELLDTNA